MTLSLQRLGTAMSILKHLRSRKMKLILHHFTNVLNQLEINLTQAVAMTAEAYMNESL